MMESPIDVGDVIKGSRGTYEVNKLIGCGGMGCVFPVFYKNSTPPTKRVR